MFHWAFMERFYLSKKMDVLADSWDNVNALEDPIGGLSQEFNQFCSSNNLTYAVVNLSSNPLQITTNSAGDYSLANRLVGNIMGQEDGNTEVLKVGDNGQYRISKSHDRFVETNFLEMWGRWITGNFSSSAVRWRV